MNFGQQFSQSSQAQSPWIVVGAIVALLLLFATWFLWRSKGRRRPIAALVCALASIALHGVLFWFVPAKQHHGHGKSNIPGDVGGDAPVMVSMAELESFEPDQPASPDTTRERFIPPLPVEMPDSPSIAAAVSAPSAPTVAAVAPSDSPPLAIDSTSINESFTQIDQLLTDFLLPDAAQAQATEPIADAGPAQPMPSMSEIARTPSPLPSRASGIPVPTQPASASLTSTVPDDFANRRGAARRSALLATGGDHRTEASVAAGLRFLTACQRPDGLWDPIASGAGREHVVLGHNRGGAGKKAQTGLTGLALLALLGNGHTHTEGPMADNVARGLQALINQQTSDGGMGGPAGTYARTYCHSIATLSLAECYAMTGDQRLARAVADALSHSARMQHPTTGGWRYQPGDQGDMSQFGWQAMAIASGKQGGMNFDPKIDRGLVTFLTSVRAGRGGLASYRPGRPPSPTMTAEALASRLLLRHNVPPAEVAEAEASLLKHMPGTGEDNFYLWYYASLALHQLQSPAWQRWNEAMKRRVLALQHSDGSWSTQTVWGGYGGNVYSTAMGCLCLEVYYRHLPLHQTPAKIATSPGAIQR